MNNPVKYQRLRREDLHSFRLDELIISYERLNGLNPLVEKAVFDGNGQLTLEGIDGCQDKEISMVGQEVVLDLFEQLLAADFINLKSRFEPLRVTVESGIAKVEEMVVYDGQDETFTLRIGQKEKSVSVYFGSCIALDNVSSIIQGFLP